MSAVPAGFVGMGYVGVMGTNHDMYFDIHLIAVLVAWVACTCHSGFTSLGNCVELHYLMSTKKAIQLALP